MSPVCNTLHSSRGIYSRRRPEAALGALPIFDDIGFPSGDLSRTGGGVSWGGIGSRIVTSGGELYAGGPNALRMRMEATASGTDYSSQQNFTLPETGEVWIEWPFYVPANFAHRDDGGTFNNKFFQLKNATNNILTIEFTRQGDFESSMRRFLSESENTDGSSNWPTSDTSTPNFIGSGYTLDLDTWSVVRVYYKAASGAEVVDGRAYIMVDGVVIHELDWAFYDLDNGGLVTSGYFLGWQNSGYDADTDFYHGGMKVWGEAPSWHVPSSGT